MSRIFEFPITNSKGLSKIIYFQGLKYKFIITPIIHEEPIITKQPIYFLSELECVARVSIEQSELQSEDVNYNIIKEIEYVLDNYLFEYSVLNHNSRLTSKITKYLYWNNNLKELYHNYDNRNTTCLVLEVLNDDSIKKCVDSNGDSFNDWCLVNDLHQPIFEKYLNQVQELFNEKVEVQTVDHEILGTGNYKLPLIKYTTQPLTYFQASMFDAVSCKEALLQKDNYLVSRGIPSNENFELKLEKYEFKSLYNPDLLLYYFCALREDSPKTQFLNLYNIIEYFFEDAAEKFNKHKEKELECLKCVFKIVATNKELYELFNNLERAQLLRIQHNRITSSEREIKGLKIDIHTLIDNYADRLYQIRNACVHSKRTYRGGIEARLVPASNDENILEDEINILRILSAKCIKNEDKFIK